MDGYVKLLQAIFRPEDRWNRELACRVCGESIQQSIVGVGFMCIDCLREKNRERSSWYYLQHPDRVKAYNKRYVEKNPHRARAWAQANFLYPKTQLCQVEGCHCLAHRHHPDYSKPKEITWLCAYHHKQEHKVLDSHGKI